MVYHNFIGYGIPVFFTFYSTSYEPRKEVGEQRDWLCGVPGGVKPPPNSEDIGGVLNRTSKKNQHLYFLL